jgi:pyruvate/2-oxoglutarate dehydrogenase complex dihydrolipoamide dehydrogenase (E3) component
VADPDYDVIVLGGGSAGSAAADAAVKAGARTAMINDGELGGLCVLRGCMPSKAMLASAHAIHAAGHLEPFGARLEGSIVTDFPRIMQRKAEMVARFKRAKILAIEQSSYDVIDARARFAEGGGVDLGDRTLTAGRYVIATGSTPNCLPLPGIDEVRVLYSDDVMQLTEQPRALLVQGAGAVGLELGQFFARIGTEVLVVNRSPLLSHCDRDCGAELARVFADEPRMTIAAPGRIEQLRRDGTGLVASVSDENGRREFRADALLMALGRRAALADLGLRHVGLEPVDGRLECDEAMRTAHPDVYLAGDATGTDQILHVANDEGRIAGHNAAGGSPERRIDRRLEMYVVFIDPPYAQIGMTEATATRKVAVGRARFPETGRAITMGATHGVWKLLADPTSGAILGSSILGPHADDLVHLVALMMHFGAKISDIPKLPWYHPTLPEVLLDLERDLSRTL